MTVQYLVLVVHVHPLQNEDGWWRARCNKKAGLIPSNYSESLCRVNIATVVRTYCHVSTAMCLVLSIVCSQCLYLV